MRYYQPGTNMLVMPQDRLDYNIWFKDSAVILEAQQLTIMDTVGVSQTYKVVIDHYTYIDLRTMAFYEYSNFSDTARLVDKFRQPDSAPVRGAWNFLRHASIIPTAPVEELPDTLMDGYMQKVYRWRISENGEKGLVTSTMTGYTRCDKKGSLFTLDKAFSNKAGCPLVRWTFTSEPPVYPGNTGWLEFERNSLTAGELRVFAAWEKAAQADKNLPFLPAGK